MGRIMIVAGWLVIGIILWLEKNDGNYEGRGGASYLLSRILAAIAGAYILTELQVWCQEPWYMIGGERPTSMAWGVASMVMGCIFAAVLRARRHERGRRWDDGKTILVIVAYSAIIAITTLVNGWLWITLR